MIPQIVNLGPIPINSFGLMVALSILAGIQLLGRSFERHGIDRRLADTFVFTLGICGLLGARLWYMLLESWSETRADPLGALLSSAGFTFYGGFIVSFLLSIWLCRRHSIRWSLFVDLVGPTLALGYAIGRLGCQLSGDGDYGMATDSWWGMSYASGVVPTPPGVLVYPTPLFESCAALLVCWLLLRVEQLPNWQPPFKRFGLYLILMSCERFAVEFLRINPRLAWGLSEAQLVALALFAMGGAMLIRARQAAV